MPEFPGLKLTQDAKACLQYKDLHKVEVVRLSKKMLMHRRGTLGSGYNSGFQTVNLLAQFGVTKIILVGYDARVDKGVHWHGRHEGKLNNPSVATAAMWRAALDNAAADLAAMGVQVLNASPVSALTAFPFVDFREAIA